jgi:hypothetical protein
MGTDLLPPGAAQSPVARVLIDERAVSMTSLLVVARPVVSIRGWDHPGSNWIQVDIAATAHEVPLSFDGTGLVSSVPDSAAAALDAVDVPGVSAGNAFHQLPETLHVIARIDDEVDMVGHEAIAEEPTPQFGFPLRQRLKIEGVVGGRREDDAPVVSPLDHVVGMVQ